MSDAGVLPEATLPQRIATSVGGLLARGFSRRGVLGRAAVVGAALAVSPFDFVLKPGTAYASVCGPGNTCGSGWTAMCCTINNGINQCPPGSFAGGWWKADSAGLCGGKARYYIDCQGECTRCGCGGGNFCAEGCWNCTKHCASGTCDERHVCWNVFRYGQCNQQIGCSGPVLCRMISCVPPWQYENCTTDAATDNNTTDHNAPCLPQSYSAIQARYTALGGPRSALGVSSGAEYAVVGGVAQNYVNGRIYDGAGAIHYVIGTVLTAYLALGGPQKLGFPATDDIADPNGGHHTVLADGNYLQASAAGAFLLAGAILQSWLGLGGARSALGFPATVLESMPDGTPAQRFQGGYLVETSAGTFTVLNPAAALWSSVGPATLGNPLSNAVAEPGGGHSQPFSQGAVVYYSPKTPAVALQGPAAAKYVALGGGGSVLGYPVAAATSIADGSVVVCQNGGLYTGSTGSFELHGPIFAAYQALGAGGPAVLGLPTADQQVAGGRRGMHNTFANGVISSSRTTGTHVVSGPIASAWMSRGAEDGALGFPLTDVTGPAGSTQQCVFEGGMLTYDPATGAVS